jgi:hypothetical protein
MLLVALAVAAGCMGANSSHHTVPPGFGTWSLACLGYRDLVLHEDEKDASASRSITYRLPAGSHEGHGSGWLLKLHYAVAVRSDAHPPAEFNVAAATNDRFCASTIWTIRRGADGRLLLHSDDVGLVQKHVTHTSTKLVREIRFTNYLQFKGVRPGLNVLRFDLTSNEVPLVRWLRIYADTALVHQRRGP